MARAQQRGVSGVTIGLIVFAALFLTSTVFLVILYTDQEKLRQEADSLRDRKERAVSAAEENSLALLRSAKTDGPTMVGLMEEARSTTARLAVGAPEDDPAAIQTKITAFMKRLQADQVVADPGQFADLSLLASLERMYELYRTESSLRAEAEKRAADLSARVDSAIAENTSHKTGFDDQVKALEAKLADCQSSRDSLDSAHRAKIADFEQSLTKLRADMNAAVADERQQKSGWQQRYAELISRYTELQTRLGSLQVSPGENVTARQPDGRVLKAVVGDDAVYVNLGAKDALVLGMEFAVYPASGGIPADGRAKARIRVEAIHESSAECRVMQVARNETINEGDLIANPIFDRNRPLSFVVVGDFDIDRNGETDGGGEFPVEALVKDWGGTVTTELTALTDFVIVGLAPRVPPAAGSADAADRAKAAQLRRDRYDKMIESAKTLSVPVLTQDVFLHFLGYAGRSGGPQLAAQ